MMYAAGVCGLGALSECILKRRVKKEIEMAKDKAIKEYKIIVDCEKLDKIPHDNHTILRRLDYNVEMPPGYLEISHIRNVSIYDKNGRLLPKLQSLKKFYSGGCKHETNQNV